MSIKNYHTKLVFTKNGNITNFFYKKIGNNKFKRITNQEYFKYNLPYFRSLLNGNKISLFYDNNSQNFHDCDILKNVIPIKVNETINDNIDYNNLYFKKSDNSVKTLIRNINNSNHLEVDNIDLKSGITIRQINKLINFIHKYHNNIDYIILDWDRTFTIIEGLYNFNNLNNLTQYLLGSSNIDNIITICKYYFGGEERYKALRNLMRTIKNYNIKPVILTNNRIAVSNPNLFVNFIKMCGYDINPYYVMYNNSTKYKTLINRLKINNSNSPYIDHLRAIIINILK